MAHAINANGAMNNRNQIKKPNWKFTNALKIDLAALDYVAKYSDILTALKNHFDSEMIVGEIRAVANYENSKTWIVSFGESIQANEYFNKVIKINDTDYNFSDPNEIKTVYRPPKRLTKVLRFHYLPENISNSTIKNFIETVNIPSLLIEKIYEERFNVDGFKHVRNGVIRVKITVEPKYIDKVNLLVGSVKIGSLKSTITMVGDTNRCFYCLDSSHISKNCPIKKNTMPKM